jgi:RecJ-like exonuclease
MHGVCSGCHGNDRCVKCHGGSEKPAFAHATTGWKLNRFHAELACRACHPTGKKISRLATDCVSCHSGWNRENFEHVIAGLQLDEVHAELDCSDCHMDKKFESRPECSSCHDDGRTYEKNPPGKFVKLSQK